jgi:hypothetical protein
MMCEESANDLYSRTNPEIARMLRKPLLRTRHPLQRTSCWKLPDKVNMIDTILQGWKCPPIYTIKHLNRKDRVPNGEEHVFDGAHKLEAIFEFMNDDRRSISGDVNPCPKYFKISATKSSCKEMQDNNGKYFHELPDELQERIRTYTFTINVIDEETVNNPDRLQTLWERLNRSGIKLNSWELKIPVLLPLIDKVLKPAMEQYAGTQIFPAKKGGVPISQRGEIEQRLQTILALCDSAEHRAESIPSMIERWHTEKLGCTMREREANVEANAGRWIDVLGRARAMLRDMEEFGVFHKDGEEVITDGLRKTELPFVLGRLARAFPRIELFRHQKERILTCLRDNMFCKSADEMLSLLRGSCRDGRYQKKLVEHIDSEIIGEVTAQPRLFTKKKKVARLREQGGLCALCAKKIEKHEMAEGDHIVGWSEGGDTTMENLQIVHRRCHQAKTAGSSSNAV